MVGHGWREQALLQHAAKRIAPGRLQQLIGGVDGAPLPECVGSEVGVRENLSLDRNQVHLHGTHFPEG